jgi:hypothetical protein
LAKDGSRRVVSDIRNTWMFDTESLGCTGMDYRLFWDSDATE